MLCNKCHNCMLQSGLKLSEGSDYLWYYLQKLNKAIKSGRGGQGGRKYIREEMVQIAVILLHWTADLHTNDSLD